MADLSPAERLRRRTAIEGRVVSPNASKASSDAPSLCEAPRLLDGVKPGLSSSDPDADDNDGLETVFDEPAVPPASHLGSASSYYGTHRPVLYDWLRLPEEQRDEAVEARRNELLADEILLTSSQGHQEWLALLDYRNQALEAATILSPQKQREQQDPIVAGSACVECAARGKLIRFTTFRPRVWCANCGRYVCGACAPSKVGGASSAQSPISRLQAAVCISQSSVSSLQVY